MPIDVSIMLKSWDELTYEEISDKLSKSGEDIAIGRVCTQEELDSRMRARFSGRKQAGRQTDYLSSR